MGKKQKERQTRATFLSKIFLWLAGVALLAGFATAYYFYLNIYAPSVNIKPDDPYIYIHSRSNYNDLLASLQQENTVRSVTSFDRVARKMNLPNNIHPGKYRLENGMSNYALVSLLRSGKQEPVKLVLNKFRLKEDLAAFISQKLETDSLTLITALNDAAYLKRFSVTAEEAMCLIIPNTYLIYWNSDAGQFLTRMKKEYDRFWTANRKQQATKLKLTQTEVITLASIVEEETNYNAEKNRIAGVYLNRLRKGMPLQADPTVKFALKNFMLKRILKVHLDYVSPYNTYRVKGLPPGPICTPSIASIDAVLQAERNDYYYFCADPDKPGTHVFARDLRQHLLNAKRYQQWLNQQQL